MLVDTTTLMRRPAAAAAASVALLGLMCAWCLPLAQAEPLFHRRDMSDLPKSRTPQKQAVQTESDAQAYLIHYGYLNCTRRQRRGSGLSDMLGLGALKEEMEIQAPRHCSLIDFTEAMSKFQKAYGLPDTGTLNEDSKSFMSFSRCGNKDTSGDEDEVPKKEKDTNVLNRHVIRRRAVEYLEREARDAMDAERDKPGTVNQLLVHGERAVEVSEGEPNARKTRSDMYDDMVTSYRKKRWAKFLRTEDDETRSKREAGEQEAKRRLRRGVFASNDSVTAELINKFVKDHGPLWTWRLLADGISGKLPPDHQRSIIRMAYRIWSEVIPINFHESNSGDINEVDVTMGFGKHIHFHCTVPFDGPGGVIAHSSEESVHIDEDECYRGFISTDRSALDQGCIYLLQVALHEIGHVLGLNHSQLSHSIMQPVMPADLSVVELSTKDREAAQKIWGKCGGTFDAVFDLVRKKATIGYTDAGYPEYIYSYYYNSYFYRKSNYWMYENRFKRPRYGDPLSIPAEWKGIPTYIDAATQVLYQEETPCQDCVPNYDIHTYFFKDDEYFEYDQEEDEAKPGFPRKIADDFSPHNSSEEGIPSNLDAVFYDNLLAQMLFLKGEYVWGLNPFEYLIHQKKVKNPPQKWRFDEIFVTPDDANFTLTGNIDTVYYSNSFRTTFIFVGEKAYVGVPHDDRTHYVLYEDKYTTWNQRWHDICDVD